MIISETIHLKPSDMKGDFNRVCLDYLKSKRKNKIYKPVGYILDIIRIVSASFIVCEGSTLTVKVNYEISAVKPCDLTNFYPIVKLLEAGIFVQLDYAHVLIVGGVLKNKTYVFECCKFSFYDRISFKPLAYRLKKYKGNYVYAVVANHICKQAIDD
ncbi:hypothetical protein LCDVSa121R [Lymphocystis disease virus 3]|uniref:Uncharacterized protein n=1 Tax=Lymphocystis disease virus 3 TaxID=2560566 RepID=A0A1B2RW35_9VIRU|nr:hypothetical protein BZK12_gp121 [Lymphocystis disease virus Sa]AOC55205.1 hypothetical protein LCDVSa121R [Lymphocystis disease virus 3]